MAKASSSRVRSSATTAFVATTALAALSGCTSVQVLENWKYPYPDTTPGVEPARPLAGSVARTLGPDTNSLGMSCSVTGVVMSGSMQTLLDQMTYPLPNTPAEGAPTVVRDFLAVCTPPSSQPPRLGNVGLPVVTVPPTTYGGRPVVAFDATGDNTKSAFLNPTPIRDERTGLDCDIKLPNIYTGQTGPAARIMGMTVRPLDGHTLSALPVVTTVRAGVQQADVLLTPKVECRAVRGVFSPRPFTYRQP